MECLIPVDYLSLAKLGGLTSLRIGPHQVLPIVQAGMPIGVSAHQLAGAVAKCGAVGTIASMDLRRLHPDLYKKTCNLLHTAHTKKLINQANQEALIREIALGKKVSEGHGLIAVNILYALSDFDGHVEAALKGGAAVLVISSGLALHLPDLVKHHPDVGLIPTISSTKDLRKLLGAWLKKERPPAAIILEGFNQPIEKWLPEIRELLLKADLGHLSIIVSSDIASLEQMHEWQSLGVCGFQMSTSFAVTSEGDASDAFKEVILESTPPNWEPFKNPLDLHQVGLCHLVKRFAPFQI